MDLALGRGVQFGDAIEVVLGLVEPRLYILVLAEAKARQVDLWQRDRHVALALLADQLTRADELLKVVGQGLISVLKSTGVSASPWKVSFSWPESQKNQDLTFHNHEGNSTGTQRNQYFRK